MYIKTQRLVIKPYADMDQDKMIELSKEIKKIIDDKSKYTDYLVREDIKANLQFDLAVILDEYGYPPVTIDDVFLFDNQARVYATQIAKKLMEESF